jgi:hypothetical protein
MALVFVIYAYSALTAVAIASVASVMMSAVLVRRVACGRVVSDHRLRRGPLPAGSNGKHCPVTVFRIELCLGPVAYQRFMQRFFYPTAAPWRCRLLHGSP